jgi:hypothetical protein
LPILASHPFRPIATFLVWQAHTYIHAYIYIYIYAHATHADLLPAIYFPARQIACSNPPGPGTVLSDTTLREQAAQFDEVMSTFSRMLFDPADVDQLLRILAAVLLVGDTTFVAGENDNVCFSRAFVHYLTL